MLLADLDSQVLAWSWYNSSGRSFLYSQLRTLRSYSLILFPTHGLVVMDPALPHPIVEVRPEKAVGLTDLQRLDTRMLKEHAPECKRSGRSNAGESHRYLGSASLIGWRTKVYKHPAGKYKRHRCRCQQRTGRECSWLSTMLCLLNRVAHYRHRSCPGEDFTTRQHMKIVTAADVIFDVMVAGLTA